MLPELKSTQSVFIEITNPVHGGPGWELGACLWSPVYSKDKKTKTWQLMERIKPGDLVIHLVDLKNKYHWYAVSIASSNLIKLEAEPPRAGNWKNMSPYQRVNIENFVTLESPVPVSNFLNQYKSDLEIIRRNSKQGQFYNAYKGSNSLRVAQRYVASCSQELYSLFDQFSSSIEFTPEFGDTEFAPSVNEPQHPDYSSPGRVKTTVSRIVRDTVLAREVKSKYSWRCQICGTSIRLPNTKAYAEAHHLKPLGSDHKGPDIVENIIVLCPTHHAEFDYGSVAINTNTHLIEHIDSKNAFHGKDLFYERKNIDKQFLEYHYNTIFNAY